MKKKAIAALLIAVLCAALFLQAALAETRQSVIMLEGQEEPIEETLFDTGLGFSLWYPKERLEVYIGEANGLEGAVVGALYSDGYMVLSMITKEDAEEYAEDVDQSFVEKASMSRAQLEVYRELENGTYHFLTLVAENGQYLRAVGEYAEEALEGYAKFFQRVLDNAVFASGTSRELSRLIPGEWAVDTEGIQAALTLDENGGMSLDCYDANGEFDYSYEGTWSLSYSPTDGDCLTLHFTSTGNPKYNESEYSAECVYAAYTESWVEGETLFTYLLLNPPISCTGVSPFEELYGSNDAALYREKGPNMRVVKCKEFVSLRAERSTSAKRLIKVPLGALVLAFPEHGEKNGFIDCVYHDEEGYILAEYLQPVE